MSQDNAAIFISIWFRYKLQENFIWKWNFTLYCPHLLYYYLRICMLGQCDFGTPRWMVPYNFPWESMSYEAILQPNTLTSQINVVLRLVFLRFCVSLRSLIQGTTFSFLPLLHNPSFICSIGVDAKDYSCYLVCYMDIFYIKVYVKRAAESDFGIQIDIE